MRAVNLLGLLLIVAAPLAQAADEDVLEAMLHDFLANADRAAAHETFWDDDLVYSSSSGLRFGKADIMAGFAGADEPAEGPPPIAYSAEDVSVRVYGNAAVVAFKLVGTPSNGTDTLYYYNTGTFLKRDGTWKVIAWQATKIPAASE